MINRLYSKSGFWLLLLVAAMGFTFIGCSLLFEDPGNVTIGTTDEGIDIEIEVVDAKTGGFIAGALIEVDGERKGVTNSEGVLILRNVTIAPGFHNFGVSKIGFNKAIVEVDVDSGDSIVEVTISLVPNVISIVVEPLEDSVAVGGTTALTAIVTYSNEFSDDDVTWTSSDDLVATVESGSDATVPGTASGTVAINATSSVDSQTISGSGSGGIVTGVASGNVTITATSNVDEEKSSSAEVAVEEIVFIPLVPISVEVDPTAASINVGGTKALTVTVTYSDGTTDKAVSWTSSDESVATVVGGSDAVVTGHALGSAAITATSDGDPTKSAAATITVVTPVTSVEVTPETASINVGGTKDLTVTVTYSDGTTDKAVSWTSSDESVATVVGGSDAVVTGQTSGSAVITATSNINPAISDSSTITVDSPPPPPQLFVTDSNNDMILELDPSTGAVINSFPAPVSFLSAQPEGLAFSGSSLFFVDDFSDSVIYELNPANGDIINSFPSPLTCTDGLGYSDGFLYALDYCADEIYVLDPADGSVIGIFFQGGSGFGLIGGITSGGNRNSLFVSDGSGMIYEIDITDGSVINTLPSPSSFLFGLGFSQGLNTLFVVDGTTIFTVNPDTGAVTSSFSELSSENEVGTSSYPGSYGGIGTSNFPVSITGALAADESCLSGCVPPSPPPAPSSTITGIIVTPPVATIFIGGTLNLTGLVIGTGSFDPTVNWSIQSGGGTISGTSGPAVTFTAAAVAGTTIIRATAAGDPTVFADATVTVNTWTKTSSATVLLVDDRNLTASLTKYTTALNNNSVIYDTFTVSGTNDGPPDAIMAQYTAVVWVIGDDCCVIPPSTLTTNDIANLTTYLGTNGGQLFISGRDLGYDISSDPSGFYGTYLHAIYNLFGSGQTTVYGASADPISGIFTSGLAISESNFVDEITPTGGGIPIFSLNSVGGTPKVGLSFSGSYKVVYTTFGFHSINNQFDADTLMSNILNFFGITTSSPPPPNDDFANATTSGSVPFSHGPFGTTAATTEPSEPGPTCGSPPNATVWYDFTPVSDGTYQADTLLGSDYDTVISVFTGTTLATLTEIACNNDEPSPGSTVQSLVQFTATVGTTYHIQVGGSGGASGNLTFNLDELPPTNDNFANATVVGPLAFTDGPLSTTLSTTEAGETLPSCGFGVGNTVWYNYSEPPGPGSNIIVDTIGSDFDTVLGVFTGAVVTSLTQVNCDDDAGGLGTSQLSFPASGGTTYRIQVGGYSGVTGNLVFKVDVAPTTYYIETFPNGSGSGTDTKIDVYESDGTTLIGTNDDGGFGGGVYSGLTVSLTPGQIIFIRVYGFSGSSTGPYSVWISNTNFGGSSAGTPSDPDSFETGDNTSGGATTLSLNTPSDHTLSTPGGDEDWSTFTAP